MSDVMTATTEELTQEPVAADEANSISAHAQQFGGAGAGVTEPPEPTGDHPEAQTDAEKAHHSETQRRDKENGQFAQGHKRVRPSKDLAQRLGKAHEQTAEAVRRAEEAEQQRTGLATQLEELRAEVERLKRIGASTAQIEKAEAKADRAEARAEDDPEPNEDDEQFGGDYGKYLKAQSRWEARQEWKRMRAEESQHAASQARLDTWGKRMMAAKERYPDFERVALDDTLQIPEGSAVDEFIMVDEQGPDVLYYLRSHPEELDSILREPSVLKQVKRLSTLPISSPEAGATRSVGRPVVVLPKPPNLVRTEAQRVVSSPPLDGSLSSIDAHSRAFGKR